MKNIFMVILWIIIGLTLILTVWTFLGRKKTSSTNSDWNASNLNTLTTAKTKVSEYKLFFIALGDNGKSGELVGCGDSIVEVKNQTQFTPTILAFSVEKLLSLKDQYYGQSGLYNALAGSNLTLESASIEKQIATVKLKGELSVSGTCEAPRILAELQKTVLQFPSVKEANILINGQKIEQLLSQKGN